MNAIELKSRAERLASRLNALGFTKNGKPLVVDQAYELVAAEEGFRNQHVLRTTLQPEAGSEKKARLAAAAGQDGILYFRIPRALDEEFAKALLVQHTLDDMDYTIATEAWELIVAEAAKRAGRDPVSLDSESDAWRAWKDLASAQGWNGEGSQYDLMDRFIRNNMLMGDFAKYARTVADDENGVDPEAAPASDDTHPLIEDKTKDSGSASDTDVWMLSEAGYTVQLSDLKRYFWQVGDVASEDFDSTDAAWDNALLVAVKTTAEALGLSTVLFKAMRPAEKVRAFLEFNPGALDVKAAVLARCGYEMSPHETVKDVYVWQAPNDTFSRTTAMSRPRAIAQAWAHAKVKTGLPESVFDAAPCDSQLVMLEAALTGRVFEAPTENPCKSIFMPAPPLNDESRKAIAEKAYVDFDFKAEVAGDNGWEWTTGGRVFTRAVFLVVPGADSRKVTFTVTVNDFAVESAVSDAPAPAIAAMSPMAQAIEALQAKWGAEHSHYAREDWQHDVAAADTKLGYWEWVQHNIESHGGEDEHCSCGAPLNDGEGYDGKCGTCADRADPAPGE